MINYYVIHLLYRQHMKHRVIEDALFRAYERQAEQRKKAA